MLEHCLGYLDAGRFTTPEEKYRYLRALPHLLLLLDDEKINVFKDKRLTKTLPSQGAVQALLRGARVRGHRHRARSILALCPNFGDSGKAEDWGIYSGEPPAKAVAAYTLDTYYKKIRELHGAFSAEFSQVMFGCTRFPFGRTWRRSPAGSALPRSAAR